MFFRLNNFLFKITLTFPTPSRNTTLYNLFQTGKICKYNTAKQQDMTDKRIFDYLDEQLLHFPQAQAFGARYGHTARYLSTQEIATQAKQLAKGLLDYGIKPGDMVATVVSQTTPEWIIVDFALLQIGVLNVPMYPTISPREYAYILQESGCRICFVGSQELYEKVAKAQESTPGLEAIFGFTDIPGIARWDSLLRDGDFSEIERIKASIKPDDLCTIIYTSGTTGNPKGVMLSHRNIVFNVEAMRLYIPLSHGERALSFLPISHIFERAVVYAYTAYGASVFFTIPDRLGGEDGELQAIKPHFFSCVPRLLEKVYERIMNKGLVLKGPKRWMFFRALEKAERWDFTPDGSAPAALRSFEWKLWQKLIFSKWREALGGNIRGIVTGASACPMRIMRVFNAAGIPVREGYGLTEAAPVISFCRFENGGTLLGAVGMAVDGVDIRIEPGADYRPGEGEVLAHSEGIMLGYYKKPEQTDEIIRVIDGKRYLCTGDVGMFIQDEKGRNFLKITDRKKELLKTSGGKYIAPSPIESIFKEHRLVDQVMVVGENLKFVSALIVPAVEALRDWCHKHQIEWTELSEMVHHPKVIERYQMLVDRINPHFGQFEQIKKFALLAHPWEAVKEDGSDAELTPTLKLKRRVIMEKYQSVIHQLYQ